MFDDLLHDVPLVLGVSRLVARPAFYAPQFHTFVFTAEALVAAAFVQGVGLWAEVPLAPGGRMPVDTVEAVVPLLSRGVLGFERMAASRYEVAGQCPAEIGSWPRLRAAAELAVGCLAPVSDGLAYEHAADDRAGVVRAVWYNPRVEYGFPAQAGLVSAYARLLAAARLTPKLVRQAFGLDDRPVRPAPDLAGTTEAERDEPDEEPEKKRSKPWRRR